MSDPLVTFLIFAGLWAFLLAFEPVYSACDRLGDWWASRKGNR